MLKGEKTILRAIEMEDTRLLSAWFNDFETNKNLDITYPTSRRFADTYVLDSEEGLNKRVFIIDNLDRKPIGIIVISNIRWEYRNCELGIVIYDKNYRGMGCGKDALKSAIKFVFNEMNMHLVYLNVYENNMEAIKLYESTGFKKEGTLRDRYYKNGEYGNFIVMSLINNRDS